MIKISIKNKSIIFECDNEIIKGKVAQLVKDAIALVDDVPEFEKVQEPKKAVGRPSPSCFENESQEKEVKEMLTKVKKHLSEFHFDECRVTENTIGAYFSYKTTNRYSNQKYFCKIMKDLGFDVNYRMFMRELEKMYSNEADFVIKLGKYFNDFND